LFDGLDEQALEQARAFWRSLRDAGAVLTYWQLTGRGWSKAMSAGGDGAADGG
jgi:DNA polymerase IIIc chi subunit